MATDAGPATDPLTTLGSAEVVVSLGSCTTMDEVRRVAEAVERALGPVAALIVHADTIAHGEPIAGVASGSSVNMLPYGIAPAARVPLLPSARRELFRPLANVVQRSGAKACAIVGAPPNEINADVVQALLQPLLDGQVDLVLPCYQRHRLDGLINSGLVVPLTCALYGRRVDGQLGADLGLSARLLAALAGDDTPGRERPIWPLTEAVKRDLPVGQTHLPTSPAPVESADDLSTALAHVLGSLFEDMDRHAAIWQRTRAAVPVPVFGKPQPADEERRSVDPHAMIESFRLGLRNLRDIWSLVLPPATLIELGRLARMELDRFRVSPVLWARVIFDFALAHRLRVINRDHLLRAFTPLYLAWVASFVLDVGEAERSAAAASLERLSQAFESEKPYLLARWRWPDRFHP